MWENGNTNWENVYYNWESIVFPFIIFAMSLRLDKVKELSLILTEASE